MTVDIWGTLHDVMLFIYHNWVSSRWQRSENLYKNGKEIAMFNREKPYTKNTQTIHKHGTHKIEITNIQNKKQILKKTIIKNILNINNNLSK